MNNDFYPWEMSSLLNATAMPVPMVIMTVSKPRYSAARVVTIRHMNVKTTLLDKLKAIVGSDHVLTGEQVSSRATHFWDTTPLQAFAIVRPENTEQTAAVIRLCQSAKQSVVTHGGLTGLVDGNRSLPEDIVLSLERQREIEFIDPIGRTMTVQAGVQLQTVQKAAADAGLQFGLDLGARGSCTIGGNLSTNAGGLSVLRYGMAREQVLGLEVVLADGTILSSMNSLLKNNAGYDLKHMFIGSEGTLGIITRAVLRLRPQMPKVHTALLAFERFDQITATLGELDCRLNGTLDAFEVLWQSFYQLNTQPGCEDTVKAPLPTNYPYYAIVESRASDIPFATDQFQSALEFVFEKGLICDAAVAKSNTERHSIWHIREHIDRALAHDPVFVYDISLPIHSMNQYITDLERNLEKHWPKCSLYVYGHLADSNLHILIAPEPEDAVEDAQRQSWESISNNLVYGPLGPLGGSVSAEHGIGLLKKDYLSLCRNDNEIQLMKLMKRTLDPACILNPGKIVSIE
ncbi:MAG: FAD-binding oxidoreductase [Granulosicoccus sp.]|nr:FAD-binding oxidoreductase [Granulosicoccus sp.]